MFKIYTKKFNISNFSRQAQPITKMCINSQQIFRRLILFFIYIHGISLDSVEIDAIEKVVIWGHKLHSHTHSYIHYGFFKGFQSMGYPTYWLDNTDDVSNFDFSNTLFLTEHNVDQKIPIRTDCFYILHWGCGPQYEPIRKTGNLIFMIYYNDQVLSDQNAIEYEPFVYFNMSTRFIHLPWATDLLPEEIDKMKEKIRGLSPKKEVCYTGTIGEVGIGKNTSSIIPFFEAAEKNGFTIKTNDPWSRPLSSTNYQELNQNSLLSPALQGDTQLRIGYIPCRIFKNISYGCMGITNSYRVFELFKKKIIYDPCPEQLFYKSIEALKTHNLEKQYEIMDFIRDHHTYINRIEAILEFIRRLEKQAQLKPSDNYWSFPDYYWKGVFEDLN
jgi:hypothetical protein